MIKLKYVILNSGSFLESFGLLMKDRSFESFTSYKLNMILKKINEKLPQIRQEYVDWADAYCEKDEKGIPVTTNETPNLGPFKIIEEKKEDFAKKLIDFLQKDLLIDSPKLLYREIKTAKLSAVDIGILEPIFEPLEEVSEPLQTT